MRIFLFVPVVLVLVTGCHSNDPAELVSPKQSTPQLFTDITERSRLKFINDPAVEGKYFFPEVMGFGCAFLDYDNDGRLDIYLINGAWRQNITTTPLENHLYHQENDGTFRDVTHASGAAGHGYGQGIAVGDIDNDGDVDIFLSNYGPDVLLRNNGNGMFSDITAESGIRDEAWGTSAAFLDYDRDGFLDLYVANYVAYDEHITCTDKAGRPDYCGPSGFQGAPDILYHNLGHDQFHDVSKHSHIAEKSMKGMGVVVGDFNSDGWHDIYVANDGEPNNLWINDRNGAFADQAAGLGAAVNVLGQPEAGMGLAAGDIDNDGDFDFFVTHLRNETNTFFHNMGAAGFQDDTATSGLGGPSLPYTGFGTAFVDFDNDGNLDVPVVNGRVIRGPRLPKNSKSYWDDYAEPNLFFENNGNGSFQNINQRALAFTSPVENSRGLAVGDVDNDGDVDFLILNAGGPARLLRNDVLHTNHWLMVRAVDSSLNRDAVGAVLMLETGGRKITRLLSPAGSYESSSDFRVLFGLGSNGSFSAIRVLWPDGTAESFAGGSADRSITLRKGSGVP